MGDESPDQARVKLVASYPGGALFVAVFGNGLVEIRDCDQEDPTAVRSSVTVLPEHAGALAEALNEAHIIQSG